MLEISGKRGAQFTRHESSDFPLRNSFIYDYTLSERISDNEVTKYI